MFVWVKLTDTAAYTVVKCMPACIKSFCTCQVFPSISFTTKFTCTLVQQEAHHFFCIASAIQSLIDRCICLRIIYIVYAVQVHAWKRWLCIVNTFLSFQVIRFIISVLFRIDGSVSRVTSSFSSTVCVIFVRLTTIYVYTSVFPFFIGSAVTQFVNPGDSICIMAFSFTDISFCYH